jgi:uncharacterized integral membrane protein
MSKSLKSILFAIVGLMGLLILISVALINTHEFSCGLHAGGWRSRIGLLLIFASIPTKFCQEQIELSGFVANELSAFSVQEG